jgi:hypothetical protein
MRGIGFLKVLGQTRGASSDLSAGREPVCETIVFLLGQPRPKKLLPESRWKRAMKVLTQLSPASTLIRISAH